MRDSSSAFPPAARADNGQVCEALQDEIGRAEELMDIGTLKSRKTSAYTKFGDRRPYNERLKIAVTVDKHRRRKIPVTLASKA